MTKWQQTKLENIVDIIMGQSPKSEYYNYIGEGIPFLQGNRTFGDKYPTFDTYTTNPVKIANIGDIIMSVRAPVGDLNITPVKMCLGRGVCSLRMKNNNQEFLFYLMKYYVKDLLNRESGTVFGSVNKNDIGSLNIFIPKDSETQKKIAGVLSALDDKIELNNKINQNLEQQAQALIQENILIQEARVPLDEFCDVFTGRKNANEFDKNGKNKFFTCGPEALTINSFIFDGPAIIVSGNGAYTGRTKFYNGKFDLYQRTYACTLKENINSNYIYLLYPLLKMILEKKLMGGTHGSAIPYIVMNDIAKFDVPFNKTIFDTIAPIIKTMVDKIQENEVENEKIAQLRDTLLPKLMSGELDVSQVDISKEIANN